jgi:hypothetical protein
MFGWNSTQGLARKSRRLLITAAVLVGASVPVSYQASAEAVRHDAYIGLTPIPDQQLRQLRGGLKIAGLDLNFGALVKTYINNVKVATTQFTLNDNGSMSQSTSWTGAALPPGLSIASFQRDDAPVGLSGIKNMTGFTVKDNGVPKSFALNAIDLGKTTQVVVNQINGVAVKQTVDATLTINNFKLLQGNLLKGAAMGAVARIGGPGTLMGIGN